MYRWVIMVLIVSIVGVGLLVADSARQVSERVSARNVELEQMLTGIGK